MTWNAVKSKSQHWLGRLDHANPCKSMQVPPHSRSDRRTHQATAPNTRRQLACRKHEILLEQLAPRSWAAIPRGNWKSEGLDHGRSLLQLAHRLIPLRSESQADSHTRPALGLLPRRPGLAARHCLSLDHYPAGPRPSSFIKGERPYGQLRQLRVLDGLRAP